MKDWERIADDLKSLGFSVGFCRAIEAFVGEVWIADASKDGLGSQRDSFGRCPVAAFSPQFRAEPTLSALQALQRRRRNIQFRKATGLDERETSQ